MSSLIARIGEVETVLQKVDPRYAIYIEGSPAGSSRARLERPDDSSEFLSRNDNFHPIEELLLLVFLRHLSNASVANVSCRIARILVGPFASAVFYKSGIDQSNLKRLVHSVGFMG